MITESPNLTKSHRGEKSLNEKQLAAIELMLLGKKTGEIAGAIGVHRRTVWAWKKEQPFRDELDLRREQLWSRASGKLASMIHPALDVLKHHLGDDYDQLRFRAACTILRLADLKKLLAATQDEES